MARGIAMSQGKADNNEAKDVVSTTKIISTADVRSK
jgi:hypothetical protein